MAVIPTTKPVNIPDTPVYVWANILAIPTASLPPSGVTLVVKGTKVTKLHSATNPGINGSSAPLFFDKQ